MNNGLRPIAPPSAASVVRAGPAARAATPAAAAAASAAPPPPASANADDPQAMFKIAANALAQLYKSTQTAQSRAQLRGYQAACADITAGLTSLPDHPLSVQSNGRVFVPLDLVMHLVAAAGFAAQGDEAMADAETTVQPTPPPHPGMHLPSQQLHHYHHHAHMPCAHAMPSASTASSSSASSSSTISPPDHQPAPGSLAAAAMAAEAAKAARQAAAPSTPSFGSLFPWNTDLEPARKRPREF
ncbi:hypothetical protein AMAG_07011 [Allomyces macrogynus ATCC 38327]|uniref:Uncharacterized protein n=1 Tax=Allomyces macrogynus (strain ATCC 38327) TaxID=578462 RepID=A0A0L0SFG3_ALLM3|nr:hypothetical protein AMAG_07011 [Allomyces macrogynus ATCC 38327]|eukprot:KNE61268.1 hypothetical protein AMAG_07011 [Allomyces macrogynus ATCC 38327]